LRRRQALGAAARDCCGQLGARVGVGKRPVSDQGGCDARGGIVRWIDAGAEDGTREFDRERLSWCVL